MFSIDFCRSSIDFCDVSIESPEVSSGNGIDPAPFTLASDSVHIVSAYIIESSASIPGSSADYLEACFNFHQAYS
jgi:hypothetical protein